MKVWLGEIKKNRNDDHFNAMFAKIFIEITVNILRSQRHCVQQMTAETIVLWWIKKNSPEKNCLSVGKNNWFSAWRDEFFHLRKKFGSDDELIIIFWNGVGFGSCKRIVDIVLKKLCRTGLIYRVKIYFVIIKSGLIKFVNNFFIEIAGNDLGFNEIVLFKKRTTLQEQYR